MTDRPPIPSAWQASTFDIEDRFGKRGNSGLGMPSSGGPMYDPGGFGGTELPSLSGSPLADAMKYPSVALQLLMLAGSVPGWGKALSLPVAAPFAGSLAWDGYRAMQQLNNEHPTQLNQQQWENALGRALQGK